MAETPDRIVEELFDICAENNQLKAQLASLQSALELANNRHVQFMVQGGAVVMAADHEKALAELATLKATLDEMRKPDGAWVIKFDDADVSDLVFVGEGAEEAARETFRKRSQSWNCHLFTEIRAQAKQKEPA